MKITLSTMVIVLVQIPLQLDYIKSKEDVFIEIVMMLFGVTSGVGVLIAMNIKDKVVMSKLEIFADCIIALIATIIVHYAMLFYRSPYPRFIVDFAVSLFSYVIITTLKKAGDKKLKKIIRKNVEGDSEEDE